MKTKFFLLVALLAVVLGGCKPNEPANSFIGTWEPVSSEECPPHDVFYITSDSIKAIRCSDGKEHYQSHYKILRDSVAELERCWLKIMAQQISYFGYDESYYYGEVYMYVDSKGYLIIKDFDYDSALQQAWPNYANLKLKRK